MKTLLQHLMPNYRVKDYKFSLVFLVLILSVIGVMVVGSANPAFQNKQILGVLLGICAMTVISLIDYKWVLNFYWVLYVINLVLLVAVLFLGVNVNGATRWLNLGFVQFQPSDLTKIITILFYARFLMNKEESISDKKTIIQGIALIIPSLILIYKQPNLSNTICLAVLFCVLMYLGGLSYKIVGTVLAEAYQQLNSIRAIGSGKLTGKGYNNDATTSVKNGNFISEPQTDFIFAIIGEELGFVGCCAVIILLLLIVIECILIGLKARDTGGRLICGGVAALIGIQSFINISVATMIFPNTGISLPFVSYGQTSVICFFMGIGFVLNVGLQPKKYQ